MHKQAGLLAASYIAELLGKPTLELINFCPSRYSSGFNRGRKLFPALYYTAAPGVIDVPPKAKSPQIQTLVCSRSFR